MPLEKVHIEMVDDEMAKVLKNKTADQRIRIGFNLWTSARDMLLSHLKASNPDWNSERLNREGAKRMSHGIV